MISLLLHSTLAPPRSHVITTISSLYQDIINAYNEHLQYNICIYVPKSSMLHTYHMNYVMQCHAQTCTCGYDDCAYVGVCL